MDKKAIFQFCKSQGCCDGCSVRFLGVKNPNIYENLQKHISQYQDTSPNNGTVTESTDENIDTENKAIENGHSRNGDGSPEPKRRKTEACVCCLGVLEQETWPECNEMAKEMLDKKGYDCDSFACALSAPISTLLRERVLILKIKDAFPDYDPSTTTPLKEAWKWLYGKQLARHISSKQDSGAVCPLLVTLSLEYPNEQAELELLKAISPSLFEARNQQKRRFGANITRRAAEQALEGNDDKIREELELLKIICLSVLKARHQQKRRFSANITRRAAEQALEGNDDTIREVGKQLEPAIRARCVSVACARDPIYIGGRYVKLSRQLPQTPWLVNGKRMMESSVQEVIFEPLSKMLGIPPEDVERRLKFMSAGREDVDVRCRGDGRPFAIEIADPRRLPTPEQFQAVCEEICKSESVIVKSMCLVSKEELTVLKQGEESKHKTYEALCIKLSHSKHETDKTPSDPITVTQTDITNMNTYRNTPPAATAAVLVSQRTPVRVLHRRPLLARHREILDIKAALVPGHPQLFTLQLQTSAGTYVKEWVHGELGRCQPSLRHAIAADVDILALDVARVHLDWPTKQSS